MRPLHLLLGVMVASMTVVVLFSTNSADPNAAMRKEIASLHAVVAKLDIEILKEKAYTSVRDDVVLGLQEKKEETLRQLGRRKAPQPGPLAFMRVASVNEAKLLKRSVDNGTLGNAAAATFPASLADQTEQSRGGSGGTVDVTAAVVFCNCPALIGDLGASRALRKQTREAFIHSYPFRPKRGDVEGLVDVTSAVAMHCKGKTECQVDITEALTSPVPGCKGKIEVEFYCEILDEKAKERLPPRTAKLQDPQPGAKLPLSCQTTHDTTEVEKAHSKRVMWVSPVTYKTKGGTFDVWPIQFSIAGHRFVPAVGWKTGLDSGSGFAPSIPGNSKTYRFHSKVTDADSEPDNEYLREYKRSLYCVTRKKKGWDCLRHYEILSQGCVPYFVDLERLPDATMPFFPKELVLEAMNLPGVHFKDTKEGSFLEQDAFHIDWKIFDKNRYYYLAARIHEHALKYLTSHAMAEYVLKVLEAEGSKKDARRVLYVHHCYHDFLDDTLWSGFKELELRGVLDNVTDIVAPHGMSVGGIGGPAAELSRKGNCKDGRKLSQMSSAKTLEKGEFYAATAPIGWGTHRSHNEFPRSTIADPETIPQRIAAKEFDVIIYATGTKTRAWIDEVHRHYSTSDIAIMTGADSVELLGTYQELAKKGTLFVRELYDDPTEENLATCADAPGIVDAQGFDCCTTAYGGSRTVWTKGNEGWSHCSAEGALCECEGEARFGHAGTNQWAQITVKERKEFKCTNSNSGGPFVDPAIGLAKVCECAPA